MSGNRAALRVALKNARRNRRRTFYLVTLVAVPVAVAVFAAGSFRAGSISVEERALIDFGDASLRVSIHAPIEGVADWVERTIQDLDPGASVLVRQGAWTVLGSGTFGRLTDTDLVNPVSTGILRLTSGRAPVVNGEVALTEYLATRLDVGVGDLIVAGAGESQVELEVVGLLTHPVLWRHSEGVVTGSTLEQMIRVRPPGAIEVEILAAVTDDYRLALDLNSRWGMERYRFHYDGLEESVGAEVTWLPNDMFFAFTAAQLTEVGAAARSQGEEAGWDLAYSMADGERRYGMSWFELYTESRTGLIWFDNPLQTAPAIGSAVAAVLLVEVAFIAGAAFATGMRRRLREIGLMGSSGADQNHVKATVLGEGLVVGLLGGLAGASLGLVALVAGRPTLQRFTERRIDEFPLALVDIAGPVVLAVLACLLAAWLPSRSAASVPTLTALQGRMPAGQPERWVSVVGVGLAAFGTLLFSVGLAAGGGGGDSVVTVIGVVLMIGGVALLAGPIVAWVSRRGDRFPVSARIVLRDSGRHRTRAAAAVAATMVIMLLPVIGMLGGSSSAASDSIYGLTDLRPQMVVHGEFSIDTGETVSYTPESRDGLRQVLAEISAAMGDVGTADFLTIDAEVEYPARWAEIQGGADREEADGWGSSWSVHPIRIAVADEGLLRLLGDHRLDYALTADGMVLIGMEERRTHIGIDGIDVEVAEVPAVVHPTAFPRVLVTQEKARDMGLDVTGSMGLVISPRADINIFGSSFWQPVSDLGLTLDTSTSYAGANLMALALGLMVLATLLVVMVVVATITALSATEADGDLQVIVAVGAENRIRRRYLGLQSYMHTMLGTLLAAPLAVLLVKTAVRAGHTYTAVGNFATYDSSRLYVPWVGMTVLIVGLPLLVGLLTAAFVRSSPLTPPRRAF